MSEQAVTLLEAMATKMGTTVEYLWEILLRQAPVSATVGLFQCLVIVAIAVWLMSKLWRWSRALEDDDLGIVILRIAAVLVAILSLAILSDIWPDVLYGYFHPEYWALKQLLG